MNDKRYKASHAGGSFYRLLQRQPRAVSGKLGKSVWRTIAIGTRALYDVADELNGMSTKPVLFRKRKRIAAHH